MTGQHGGAIARLLFGAANHGADFVHPGLLQRRTHARQAALGKRPLRDRHGGVDQYVGVGDEDEITLHGAYSLLAMDILAPAPGSGPAVFVLQPDDVALQQQCTELYLDDLERQLRQVGQPVHHSHRNIDMLARLQIHHPVAHGDMCSALDHHPVFGPMHMFLQADLLTCCYPDPLDQTARRFGHGLVPAPGAVDACARWICG